MKNIYLYNEAGYIALLSVLIISAVLVVLAIYISSTAVLGRLNVFYYENKNISSWLAEACLDQAILKLINNSNYSPNDESVVVGLNSCAIVSVGHSGSQKTIRTSAMFPAVGNNRSYTNLQVVVTLSSGSVLVNSWNELPNF